MSGQKQTTPSSSRMETCPYPGHTHRSNARGSACLTQSCRTAAASLPCSSTTTTAGTENFHATRQLGQLTRFVWRRFIKSTMFLPGAVTVHPRASKSYTNPFSQSPSGHQMHTCQKLRRRTGLIQERPQQQQQQLQQAQQQQQQQQQLSK